MDEIKFVLDSFNDKFLLGGKTPLIIYGLGKNTKHIIEKFPGAQIVGLMDEIRTGDIVFGKKVLDFEEVKNTKVKTILILARNANLQIIYRRIKDLVKENNILVYDINGNQIEDVHDNMYKLSDCYKSISEENLWKSIESVDVVSFDIFDTLLVRDCLYPTDLFAMLNCEGYSSDVIKQCRINAERELYLETNPTIFEIYKRMEESFGFTKEQCKELMAQEIRLEQTHLFPRRTMVDLLRKIQKKKTVFLTSDMYLTRNILMPILKQNGMNVSEDKILISCEEKVAKCGGLYQRLREINTGKKILHIGDNLDADILAAQKDGIEETFYIRSVYGMLEDSRLHDLLNYQTDIYMRNKIASFANYHFENPFLFNATDGKVILDSEFQMGYYYVAPIIISFVKWMLQVLKNEHIDNVLLGARDGYLLLRIFEILEKSNIEIPQYQYLYASRAVCLLAGIRDEKDILYVASLAFNGSTEELLRQRFRVSDSKLLVRNGEQDEAYILKHKDIIFENAEKVRKRYLVYLDKLIDKTKQYAFFDFVSSGSCQMGLEKIISKSITGIYFYRVYDKAKEHLKIYSLYKERYVYEKQEALVNNYFFLENIMTSFEATLYDFNESGEAVFLKETRTDLQLNKLEEIHQGVLKAVQDEVEGGWNRDQYNVPFSGMGIQFLNASYIDVRTDSFGRNQLADEFCNRVFDVSVDVI